MFDDMGGFWAGLFILMRQNHPCYFFNFYKTVKLETRIPVDRVNSGINPIFLDLSFSQPYNSVCE